MEGIAPIPVLLIIENELYGELLKSFLQTKLYFCRLSNNLELAENLIEIKQPELVLVDYLTRPVDGVYVVDSLLKTYSSLKCIGISANFSKIISDNFETAGAKGYIWRTLPATSQLNIIKDVYDGKIVLPKTERAFKFRP